MMALEFGRYWATGTQTFVPSKSMPPGWYMSPSPRVMSFCRLPGLVHDEQVADALAGGAVVAVLRGGVLHGRLEDLDGREEDVVGVKAMPSVWYVGKLSFSLPVSCQFVLRVTLPKSSGRWRCPLTGRGATRCSRLRERSRLRRRRLATAAAAVARRSGYGCDSWESLGSGRALSDPGRYARGVNRTGR